jgi:hypothetical protein
MSNELKQAITLIKAGETTKGRERLVAALKADPTNDTAWVWMSAAVETQQLKRECLEEALKHNPRNKTAQRALDRMTPRAIFSPAADAGGGARKEKLPVMAHVLCGWPLALVAIGGAIGGALGGLAYGINIAIYKTGMPTAFKIVLNLAVGAAAVVLWYIIAMALARGIAQLR